MMRHAVLYAQVFFRGLLIVGMVSLNTRMISSNDYAGAFAVGGGISAVWWFNARTAAASRDDELPGAWIAYAVGAAVGTVTGMWIGA